MTWTKLGDDFADRPSMLEVPRSARLLLVEMYVWANRMLTDGRVPKNALRRLSDSEDIDADIAELARVGLVESADEKAWQLDWAEQDSAADVKARKDYRADVQQKYRRRKQLHGQGDHSLCDARYCRGVTGNESSNVTALVTNSRPVPSRPEDRGQGTGRSARASRSADAARSGAASPEVKPLRRGGPPPGILPKITIQRVGEP